MSELVRRRRGRCGIRPPAGSRWACLGLLLVAGWMGTAGGQEVRKIPISFLPPPLESATYSLGVYETKTGKLVRRLHEIAPESAFTAGLNGLITNWDGKDDAGKPAPPGHYAAWGYAVSSGLKVEGVGVLDNDWASDDETLRLRTVQAIALVPADGGLAVLGSAPNADEQIARYGGAKDEFLWQKLANPALPKADAGQRSVALVPQGDLLLVNVENMKAGLRLADGGEVSPTPAVPPAADAAASHSPGKDGTQWKIEEGVLVQYGPKNEPLRQLSPKDGEPVPVAVSASMTSDRVYLLEEAKGWQRVRGLSWVETKEENGKPVSTWQTFFERNIHPADLAAAAGGQAGPVEITLVENSLSGKKGEKMKLAASFDDKGSYLSTVDGLRLRQVGQRAFLKAAKLTKGKTAKTLEFFESDGAAVDEFSIEGAQNMMAFDAGEFDLTAEGEKTHPEKAAEPDL